MKETYIGPFLVLEEPSGEATVYDDRRDNWQKEFPDYESACEWARDEAGNET